jgi:hypothetical protein
MSLAGGTFPAMAGMELTYAYRVASVVRGGGAGSELLLGTSGGLTETGPAAHPHLFDGFLTDPGPAALGMLACAAVARARYYTPASVIAAISADPVVTSHGDRLRFESFSGCCGVHARLDLLPAALAGPPAASGTTNVDFNQPMRAALAGAAVRGPLRLRVGTDEVAVTTAAASVVERKVPLPDRWLKGFGEVQALARRMRPVAELASSDALRFITGIPRSLRHPLWAVPAGPTLTLATSPLPGAACLAGSHRLAELGPLLRFARALRVYAPEADTFFHRELPFGAALEAMHPRLAGARALAGSVVAIPGGALVRSGDVEHRVTFASPHDICTCPWWGRHRGTRGPCKHVLAARMAVNS